MSDKAAVLQANARESTEPAPYTKAQFEKDFLEMWKRESDECAEAIYMSLPFEKPPLSPEWKEEAIDAIIRMVWCSTHKDGEPDAIRENLAAIKEYTAELVEKVAAKEWERTQAASKRMRC